MTDVADHPVLVDDIDLFGLRHGFITEDLCMLYDVMRLQVCLLQIRCQRHHRYRRRKQASVVILENNDRTPAALLRAMRNTEIREKAIAAAIASVSSHWYSPNSF